ncbi:unnamed protein product [Caenorhabditis auriculariae]|uniref:LRRCT domain-containing protein n=1 Tax=Caenorhabditis auriculariae TaxID=2777116 RepID=A0A8S1HFP8_9PELO|nr:unnamed protein product [Caenorhabditis auriculariae]
MEMSRQLASFESYRPSVGPSVPTVPASLLPMTLSPFPSHPLPNTASIKKEKTAFSCQSDPNSIVFPPPNLRQKTSFRSWSQLISLIEKSRKLAPSRSHTWTMGGRGLLLLLGLLGGARAVVTCPELPETCSCNTNKNLLSVSCNGVGIARLAQSLGTLDVEDLKINGCHEPKITSLPFNGLRVLQISNCSVAEISSEAWKRFERTLEQLDLSGNRLKSVPQFGNFPNLAALNLNENQISNVSEKSFANMKSLTQLRIENNHVCELPPKTLDSVKGSLVLLDLSSNFLTAIPAQILRNAARLMYLDLSSNVIEEINNFELMNLAALRELRLNNNTLRRVHPMAFMNVPQLQYLYLHENLISTLDGNRLQAFKRLEILDVSNNMLQSLPSLKDLPNLKQVRMDGNLIEKIETLAFSNNPKLQLITLQNNNIYQISRNSFDSLDQLVVLLLGNNTIPKIERGMLDGMRNLQQLSVRNNSLTSLDKYSFPSLPHLTTLDLAHNKISDIQEGTFEKQSKLFWLDLSNNNLAGFKKDVFQKKISNILLNGNSLICDESFDEVLTYLVTNRVRTFLPFQPEISCAGPEKYAGVRLKDLMMKKANETLSQGIRTIGLDPGNKSILSSFLPSLGPLGGPQGLDAGLPFLRTITGSIPALQNIPGLGGNVPVGQTRGAQMLPNKNLNEAIEQFTAPLVRFATGGQPVPEDIEQLIKSIPNFIVNVPGVGDIDLNKMDPAMISYVLKGGQVPGIDKSTMDTIIKQAMQKMHTAAAASLQGKPVADESKHLPPLSSLPSELVTQVISGEPLPGLDSDQTKIIMEYYTRQMPTMNDTHVVVAAPNATRPSNGFVFSPEMFDLLKILPPGYNLSKIPMEVVNAVTRGEVPDMRLLPEDLLEYFKGHTSTLASMFARAKGTNTSLEEIIDKLPVFARPELSTFVPYDINELTSEMILEKEVEERHRRIRLYTAIALGLIGAVTIVVVAFFVNYVKKQRKLKKNRMFANTPMRPALSAASISGHSSRVAPVTPNRPVDQTSKLHTSYGPPQLSSTLLETPHRPRQPVPTPRRT